MNYNFPQQVRPKQEQTPQEKMAGTNQVPGDMRDHQPWREQDWGVTVPSYCCQETPSHAWTPAEYRAKLLKLSMLKLEEIPVMSISFL